MLISSLVLRTTLNERRGSRIKRDFTQQTVESLWFCSDRDKPTPQLQICLLLALQLPSAAITGTGRPRSSALSRAPRRTRRIFGPGLSLRRTHEITAVWSDFG